MTIITTHQSILFSRRLPAVVAAVVVWALTFSSPAASELTIQGFAAIQGTEVRSQPSFRDGGFGRFVVGASRADDETGFGLARLHLALDWQPTESFGAYLHTVARAEPSRLGDEPIGSAETAIGVIEAYLHAETGLGNSGVLRFRAGHFILPTSRENTDFTWASPYTLSFSALNTWIGEEMRLTGTLTEALIPLSANSADELRAGVSVFGGNDASGALLAWRGWGFGSRLTAFDEIVPLPPLRSLADGAPFGVQLDAGTRPFGNDLDGRLGWAGYLRWHRPDRALVQYTRLDNRGDRLFHDNEEYSWRTVADILGAEVHFGPWSLVGEALRGSTGMGNPSGPHVQADLETAYLLASWHTPGWRFSVRHDRFEIVDRDLSAAENNDEDGDSWTLAVFFEPRSDLRLGLEWLEVDADRPGAFEAGGDPNTDGTSVTLELRYYIDW